MLLDRFTVYFVSSLRMDFNSPRRFAVIFGYAILRSLSEGPRSTTRQIAENSVLDGGVVVDRMRSGKGNYGLDASTGKYVDLTEAGIIDATKVVRVALENAVSVASTLLLTEATLTEEREKRAERAPAPEFGEP